MANLTTEQATELVDNGHCMCRCIDSVYQFTKFSGSLDGDYYEIATPTQTDLGLDAESTEEECKTALITYFKTVEYKGEAPVVEDMQIW